MAYFSRRDFLKAVSLTGTAAVIGCSSESARRLIPYIIPPEDIIPSEAAWYASTCRECPAGCGILAKNREGRVVKVEGNPLHPVSQGRLCPRGQASVQGLYNPDRIRGPLKKNSRGLFEPISWDQGEKLLGQKLQQIVEKGRGERIAFVTDLITGTLKDLVHRWLGEFGSKNYFPYETLAYESLRKANQVVFGTDAIPTYRIDRADFLLSFGADFLETWLSNVEYARQFALFHSPRNSGKSLFIYMGPRFSLTAANADRWIAVPPGNEHLVALGILRLLVEKGPNLAQRQRAELLPVFKNWPLETIVAKTGINLQALGTTAQKFSQSQKPLAIAGCSGLNPIETSIAANLLCTIIPGSQETLDFEDSSALSEVAKAEQIKELGERMKRGEIELLLIHRANPNFSLPPSWEFGKALQAVPMVVSFSSQLDETSGAAHLILPTHTPLESWGDHAPQKSVTGLMQPVMGPLFDTRHLGDILLSTGRKIIGSGKLPWEDFYHFLRDSWRQKGQRQAPGIPFGSFWVEALKRGGLWEARDSKPSSIRRRISSFSFPEVDSAEKSEKSFFFTTYPTIQFFDGRGANRPWLQELPDPMTQITWGNWVEIHPETAGKLGIQKGDLLLLKSPFGTLEVPAYIHPGITRETLAMPLGQGHTNYGRFANTQPGNPVQLLPPHLDNLSQGILWSVSDVKIEKRGKSIPIANTDGSLYQHGRGITQAISFEHYQQKKKAGEKPHLCLPLPEGYNLKDDFYPPHAHPEYRWAMVVDLDRCIGCGACAVACSSENNIAIVGKEQVLKGREMSWLRIERYFEPEELRENHGVRFIPMLCQHCDDAPCESVCPVFAPHHSVEGLNNQIYNRCIGTRFCSQNCPYKVRRFNWFTFTRPEPLNWQLNPDVTVREKGVMEKCSFCVQRIKEGKLRAKYEGREVRDGEIVPACAQTCPAGVFTFGNLKDPNSQVFKLTQDPRAYQVFAHLNTKPAVIYLKKLTPKIEGL